MSDVSDSCRDLVTLSPNAVMDQARIMVRQCKEAGKILTAAGGIDQRHTSFAGWGGTEQTPKDLVGDLDSIFDVCRRCLDDHAGMLTAMHRNRHRIGNVQSVENVGFFVRVPIVCGAVLGVVSKCRIELLFQTIAQSERSDRQKINSGMQWWRIGEQFIPMRMSIFDQVIGRQNPCHAAVHASVQTLGQRFQRMLVLLHDGLQSLPRRGIGLTEFLRDRVSGLFRTFSHRLL